MKKKDQDPSLENLAIKLKTELGLVANLITTNNSAKIVGGVRYNVHGSIGIYVRKFEITADQGVLRARLPMGQTFIKKEASSDTEMYELVASHFASTD